jgi:HK97 family phage portal protein
VWGRGGDWKRALGSVGLLDTVTQPVAQRCFSILAGITAGMTPRTFQGKGAARSEVDDPPVIDNPSGVFNAYEWRFAANVSLAAAGEAMGVITQRAFSSWPNAIELVWPERFDVTDNGLGRRPSYRLDGVEIDREDVWHLRNFTRPGSLRGVDPLSRSGLLEVARAARKFGRDWFEDGATPSGLLMPTKDPGGPGADTLKLKFREAARGRGVVVLPQDTKFEQISVPANESLFLETVQQASADVAVAIGVPPEWVGIAVSGESVTYANREQRIQDLNVTTTNHYVNVWNRGLSDLLPKPRYVRLNTATLERSDLKTRMEIYHLSAQIESLTGNRIYTEDEQRDLEDRRPLPPRATPLPAQGPPRKVTT